MIEGFDNSGRPDHVLLGRAFARLLAGLPPRHSGGGRVYGHGSRRYGGPRAVRIVSERRQSALTVLLHFVGLRESPFFSVDRAVPAVRRPDPASLARDYHHCVEFQRRRERRHALRARREAARS